MLTRSDIPNLLKSGLSTIFQKAYDSVPTIYQDLVTTVTSSKSSEEYGWLGDTPELREWKSERTPKALAEYGFTIKNKKYEASIRVDNDAIEDDQYGQIVARIQSMGTGAKQSYDRQLVEVIEAGKSTACYDGQNFFDTDHSEGASGVQSNHYVTTPLNLANAKIVISAGEAFKSDTGKLVAVRFSHIMVPPVLEWTAREIFDPSAGLVATNVGDFALKGRCKVIVNPYLDGTGGANAAYYFLDLTKPIKPFIFQLRKALKFDQVSTQNPDTHVFMTDASLYGVSGRHAFGYGDWRYAVRGTGNAS